MEYVLNVVAWYLFLPSILLDLNRVPLINIGVTKSSEYCEGGFLFYDTDNERIHLGEHLL